MTAGSGIEVMITRDSELYRKHPDWCIHCENIAPIESRWQMVLDMSRSEVVDHIYEQMDITVSGAALMYADILIIMPENTDYACLTFDITGK